MAGFAPVELDPDDVGLLQEQHELLRRGSQSVAGLGSRSCLGCHCRPCGSGIRHYSQGGLRGCEQRLDQKRKHTMGAVRSTSTSVPRAISQVGVEIYSPALDAGRAAQLGEAYVM